MRKQFIILFAFLSLNIFPQVDTTDIFPLHIGDVFRYFEINGNPIVLTIKVEKDTIIKNKKYFALANDLNNGSPFYEYYREEGNKVFKFTTLLECDNEYVYYDFDAADSTMWEICQFKPYPTLRGVRHTSVDYIPMAGKYIGSMLYEFIEVTARETLWSPLSMEWGKKIVKGFGKYVDVWEGTGAFVMEGAIINGKSYGSLVNVKDEFNIPNSHLVLTSYPNPFNSEMNLKYVIPKSGNTELKIVNVIGKEVASLYKGFHAAGEYSVHYNANNLSSGVYFVVLNVDNKVTTHKIVLIK